MRRRGMLGLAVGIAIAGAGAGSSPAAAATPCEPYGGPLQVPAPNFVVRGVNEVTEYLNTDHYRVAKCDDRGRLLVQQEIESIATPDGPKFLPITVVTPDVNGGKRVLAVEYPRQDDPNWVLPWRLKGAAAVNETLDPTGPPPPEAQQQAGGGNPPQPQPGSAERCGLTGFNIFGYRHNNLYLHGYNYNSFPGAKDLVEVSVRNGIRTWTEVLNACGFEQRRQLLEVNFGRTTTTANPYGTDGSAVTDFGSLTPWPNPCPVSLACAQSYPDATNIVTEADIRMDTRFSWWAGNGNAPTNFYDIYAVMAHEVGHTLGLNHTDQRTLPTMNSTSFPVGAGGNTAACCVGRFLSGSDYRAYRALYG